MDSTARTGHAGVIDAQEESYQKIKSMKELYFTDLSEFHQKVVMKLQQLEQLLPPGKQSEQFDILRKFKEIFKRMLTLLQLSKNSIPPNMKEKLMAYEKQMQNMVASHRTKKIPQGHQPQDGDSASTAISNCENGSVSEDGPRVKRNKVGEPMPEGRVLTDHVMDYPISTDNTVKVAAREPTFCCPICMNSLVLPCSTTCGHIFCEACIKAAISVQKTCPTCRTKLVRKNSFHRVFLPTLD